MAVDFWLAELRSASPWNTKLTDWLSHNFVKWQERTQEQVIRKSWIWFCYAYSASLGWSNLVGYEWVWFGVVEFSLVWMSLVWCGWVRFGVVEFGLVWWGWFLFGLEDELNFVWFGRWTLNNSESSGSAIQLSLRTCYISNCFSKGYRSTVIRAGGVTCPADW